MYPNSSRLSSFSTLQSSDPSMLISKIIVRGFKLVQLLVRFTTEFLRKARDMASRQVSALA
jgi:hypothetical protein